MTWTFELVAGPHKGRTGGLAWDGSAMLYSAVQEERILRYDPAAGKADIFRKYTGRANGIAMARDGSVFGAQEGGRRIIHFLKDGSTAPTSSWTASSACGLPTPGTGRRRTGRRPIRFSTTLPCCGSIAPGKPAGK
jgi:hypothetical protein